MSERGRCNNMNYIYTCKLYKAHKDKDAINAAIINPVNTELIKQIEDLDVIENKEDPELSFDDFQEDPLEGLDIADVDNEDLGVDHSKDTDAEIDDDESANNLDDDEESSDIDELEDVVEDEEPISPESIQEFLNDQDSTSGVSRVVEKDSEIWIHYNDKINLNNVMEDVIARLSKEYPEAEFNRLARTENAIVFVVESDDEAEEESFEEDVDVNLDEE